MRLEHHSWPGNVRELESVICRTALLEDGPILEGHGFTPQEDSSNKPLEPVRDQGKRLRSNIIHRALDAADGNKSRAAASLKVSRKTFYRWLQEL
jgi:DNA-binding NtrC family response regulator